MRLSGRKYSPSTRRWTQRQRVVLLALIGVNLVAFSAQMVIDASQPGFVREFLALSDTGIRDAYAWQFLTAMCLHIGPWHLLGNMLILYLLGRDLESILGQRQFFFRPVARWFASDNTALELSAKLPVNTVVALKSSSPEVPFSDTWAVEGGLRSRLVPDVFGSLRLHYGRVSSALYGAQLYPSFELEMRF